MSISTIAIYKIQFKSEYDKLCAYYLLIDWGV